MSDKVNRTIQPHDPTSRLYLKCLDPGRKAPFQGTQWPPIGRWTSSIKRPRAWERGWHVVRPTHLLSWLVGSEIYIVQIRGAVDVDDTKLAAEQARLIRRLPIGEKELRAFAQDCAKHADSPVEMGYEACLYAHIQAHTTAENAQSQIYIRNHSGGAVAALLEERKERNWQVRRLLTHYGGLKCTGKAPLNE